MYKLLIAFFLFSFYSSAQKIEQINVVDTILCNEPDYILLIDQPDSMLWFGQQSSMNYQFYNLKLNKPTTPIFKVLNCSYSLNLDGDCYLDADEDFTCSIDGKVGKMQMNGRISTDFKYDDIVEDYSDTIEYRSIGNKWEMRINENWSKIKMDYPIHNTNNMYAPAIVVKNKVKFLREDNTWHDSYENELNHQSGLFTFQNGCLTGVASYNGEIIILPKYEYVEVGNDYIVLHKDDKSALMSLEGKKLTEFEFDYISSYGDQNRIAFVKDDKYGLLDFEGNLIMDPKYQTLIMSYNDGFPAIASNGSYETLIDVDGNEILAPIYKDVSFEKNGLIYASKDNIKYGYIDIKGEVIIDFKFDKNGYMYFYEYDRAKVKLDGECFYINRKGEIIEKTDCK